jgi:hypothetical protein
MTIGRRPLERNSSAFGVPAALPVMRERVLLADQKLGPLAIPIVLTDEASRGEPAGALQAVEIVVQDRLSTAGRPRIVSDGKPPGKPLDRAVERIIGLVGPTAKDVAVFHRGVSRFERGGRNRQPADARARHAAGADVAGHVSPGAVVVLRRAPIVGGELPGFAADLGADALGIVQGQNGELGVAVVAAGAGIGPRALPLAFFDLMAFQPDDIAANEQHVLFGLGGAQDHRLQRDGVRFVRFERAEIDKGFSHRRIVDADTGIQQRQRTQRRDAAVVAGHFGPAAARQLLTF